MGILKKNNIYWLRSIQSFGTYKGGLEFDVDGGLGLYDVNQDVIDVAKLDKENNKLKTIITKMFIASEDGGCINCLFMKIAELTEEEKAQLTTSEEFMEMIKKGGKS